MQHHRSRLVITTLAAAVIGACDVPDAPAPEATAPRELLDAPLADCLTDTKVVLHHADGETEVTHDLAAGLGQLARPGDEVELAFSVTNECAAKYGPRVTLASSTAVGNHLMSLVPGAPTTAFDVHTARLDGDAQLLHVRLPSCTYAVELAFGEPLAVQALPDRTYAAQSRLIASGQHVGAVCQDDPLAIERFDPIEAGWGDAPVNAHFGWQIAADPAAQLRCELDLDADGEIDETLDPCTPSTAGIKTAALPQHKYEVGKHRPELFVSDGQRRAWAATDIYSNHIDFKPNVRFLEQLPGYLSAEFTAADPSAPIVLTLNYATSDAVPTVKNGEVIVGHGGMFGYMLRVELATRQGNKLTITGDAVDLDQVVDGGFVGVRDVQVNTMNAACLEAPCPDEIEPIPDPPVGPGAPPVADKGLSLALAEQGQVDPPGGLRLVYKVGNYGEMQMSGGLGIERFELDLGFLSVDHADFRMSPNYEVRFSLLPATATFPLGRAYLGTLPTLLPVSFYFSPAADLHLGVKVTAQIHASGTASAFNGAGGWETSATSHFESALQMLDANASVYLKAIARLRVDVGFGLLTGPYFELFGGPGWRRSLHASCERCDTTFVERGAEFGWGNLFTPIKYLLPEWVIEQTCVEEEPYCGEPGGGGPTIVSPRDGAAIDCSLSRPMVFRAPNTANLDDPEALQPYTVRIAAFDEHAQDWRLEEHDLSFPTWGEGWRLACTPIGDGSQMRCEFASNDNTCLIYSGSRWSQHWWSVTANDPPQLIDPDDSSTFTVP